MSALRADALATLRGWAAPTPDQEALREHYVRHLEARPDAMTRECRPEHLTASTLVLSDDHSHVLLTLHAKAREWFQFGGHPEAVDTTLAGAALREAVEESGLSPDELDLDPRPVRLDAHAVPFCGPGGDVRHLDVVFRAVARPGARHAVSDESLDVRWWPVDALPNPELDDFVALALAGQSTGSNSEGGATRAASDQPSR